MKTLMSQALSLCVGVFASVATNATELSAVDLKSAQQCTSISERLERLNCFDQLFQTPTQLNDNRKADDKPQAWHTAFDTSMGSEPLNVVEKGSEKEGDAWLTLTAKHADKDTAPVLMMSCINNISRIELALPLALEDARIRVSIAGGPTQSWRSDDLGVLFSSARGIPAISMMKAMSKDARLELRSNSPAVDGLKFDASGLSQALKPLRSRCGW